MKFIVLGLGNFGSSLCEKLTNFGHEVIGVDHVMQKVEAIKNKISYAVCLDSSDPQAIGSLPFNNTDVVVVCIGENIAANVMTTALMKKQNVPRLISRSISALHETILEAMGIDEILRPEEESAERWANKLTTIDFVDSFKLVKGFSVVEVNVPEKFVGKTLEQLALIKNYNILVITIFNQIFERNIFGVTKKVLQAQGVVSANTVLKNDDIMVLYGKDIDIKKLLAE